jgi:hypothetical protein
VGRRNDLPLFLVRMSQGFPEASPSHLCDAEDDAAKRRSPNHPRSPACGCVMDPACKADISARGRSPTRTMDRRRLRRVLDLQDRQEGGSLWSGGS